MIHQFYNLAKVFHIVGITATAGIALIDLLISRYFWMVYRESTPDGIIIERLLMRLQRVMAIGMMLTLVSGVVMMAYLHTVWGPQVWFRIKMLVLAIVIINGLSFRRVLGKRIHARVMAEPDSAWVNLASLRSGITTVQLIQLTLFSVLFILSVFKFN